MNIKLGSNVCRVCLKSDEEGAKLFENAILLANFQFSTQIKVKKNDGLPGILCNRCVARLKVSTEFKKQSLNSDRHLRILMEKLDNQLIKGVSATTVNQTEVVIVNQDEVELLMEAGYKTKPIETVTEISIMPTPVEEEDQLDEVIEDRQLDDVDFDSIIQEEEVGYDAVEEDIECLEDVEEQEVMQLEDGTITAVYHEIQTEQESEDEDNLQDISMLNTTSQYIIDSTNESDPLQKPEDEHRCPKCDQEFSTKTLLMQHMKIHAGMKQFQCYICGNGFTHNSSLKQHMLIHTGERPYKCQMCARAFTQSKSLKFHMRIHTGEKPFACNNCGLSFRQKDGLKRHMVVKHSEIIDQAQCHICSICQRVLKSKKSLNMHMKVHVDNPESFETTPAKQESMKTYDIQRVDDKYECDKCDKKFTRKGSLLTHIKMHDDVKPFNCDICQRGFAQKHKLTAHLQTHSNKTNRTFQCEICHKSFALKKNLVLHLRNHNQQYLSLFQCDDCDIAFNTKRDLKLHRVSDHGYTDTDVNECSICHVPFVSVADFNDHMSSVHDIIDKKCQLCDEHFTSKKNFESHSLEH